jgi:regulatory protein
VRRLAQADRTAVELLRYLERYGPAEAAQAVVERLRAQGYVDDEGLARRWVDRGVEERGMGERRLRGELLARGVPREVAQREAARAREGEEAAARAFAFIWWERNAAVPLPTRLKRLTAALVRRGYAAAVIVGVLRQLRQMHQEEEAAWAALEEELEGETGCLER